MRIQRILLTTMLVLAAATTVYAQPVAPASVASEEQVSETQDQLLKLLRVSPVLTSVIERDPSLLSDQPYVMRTNPQLAEFLTTHPEVARNPDFYLFSNLPGGRGKSGQRALEKRIWPEQGTPDNQSIQVINNTVTPFLVFVCVMGALIWLTRTLLENRRYGRAIKLQTEAHSRLIERFSTHQELLAYMETEAGRRFLDGGPVTVDVGPARVPNAVARILTPLQIGVVLTLLGVGLISLRHSVFELRAGFLVAGVMVLMPGLGFIISAGLTWLLAGRLGLIPEAPATREQM